ncbi:Bacteriocin UviB [bioreactor metagenome]|uniref:Bacteriocin UviB n=2 Tax=root TaxID=1 RepID=A0ABT1NKR4_9FIRM|nr:MULTISPECIES: BhlA/UviB family holin-like peptide [Lutispora]MCQ1531791.1 hypothetical protein [Lutispora saccharofermentans]MEA4961035.1 BhlA/UviB family holin-like peptide [Lutispora sp.]HCJ55964.1 hypothetical protein [Clostridiaceae bacterium]
MESDVIKAASSQGFWAVLAVVLIFYILKAQERRDSKQQQREERYQELISELTLKLNTVESIKKEVEDIRKYINKILKT